MTVGIAAICERDDEPKVVAAADRMVTAPMGGSPIEYEHPTAKIHRIDDRPEVNAIAITSGYSSYADELYHRLGTRIEETPDDEKLSVRDIAENAADSYSSILQDTASRQVLDPLELSLQDLKRQDQFNPQFLSSLVGDIKDVQNNISEHLFILIAGVDEQGANIYLVHQADISNQNSIGYASTGSGTQPAQSEFIHTRYDDTCALREGKRVVVSAKVRAEEAQGVGENMDVVVVDDDEISALPDEDVQELREIHKEIEEKQETIKELVIREAEFEIDVLDEGHSLEADNVDENGENEESNETNNEE